MPSLISFPPLSHAAFTYLIFLYYMYYFGSFLKYCVFLHHTSQNAIFTLLIRLTPILYETLTHTTDN
jgi:hypothetical protein